jgi:hypothetical protein
MNLKRKPAVGIRSLVQFGESEKYFVLHEDFQSTGVSVDVTFSGFRICGFEDLTAVIMKGSIFWDIMPCSPLKVKA